MVEGIGPTEVTREELYRLVWETPMIRLAEKFGITGNGLAKICDRLKVPYPPRGYWAKKAAGKKVITYRLLDVDAGVPHQVTIRPTPPPAAPLELSPEVESQVAAVRDAVSAVSIPQRLLRPHPIIAGWLADHEQRKLEARKERDPWRKQWMDPGELSDSSKRRYRVLDALFKAIERHGGRAIQDERLALFVEVAGQRIEFQLREKQKQIRRPLTADEKKWQSKDDKGWRQDYQPTGKLILAIKTYLPGLRREWLEKEDQDMDVLLPDIVATLIAAGPILAELERVRQEEAHQRQIAEARRYEEQQRQKRDRNRWREFNAIARQWRNTITARRFATALKKTVTDPEQQVAGRSVQEWLSWVDEHLQSYDPLVQGVEPIFNSVAKVTEWTNRD